MYETNKKNRGLEYKAEKGAYSKVPRGYAAYKITPYRVRMPAPDRYVRRVPIETRVKTVRRYIHEKWIYGTLRPSRYGLR